MKLIALASWIGLLISAVSEYGFDVDFPLTPPLWLMIAFCALLLAAARPAVGSRIHSIGNRETGTSLSGAAPSPSDSVSIIGPVNKSSRISDRCRGICQDSCHVTDDGDIRVNLGGASITASDAMPVVIFTSPATTRGPPWANDQSKCLFGATPCRPARHYCTTPPSSEIHLPSNSLLDIKTAKGEPV